MPQLEGWRSRVPWLLKEAIAVSHLKLYLFDDELLLTGANLSSDYFEARQDRYISIKSPGLADHYHSLVRELSHCQRAYKHSMKDGEDEEKMDTGDGRASLLSVLRRFESLNHTVANESNASAYSYENSNSQSDHEHDPEYDTWVFPTLQLGELGVTHDESATCRLLGMLQEQEGMLQEREGCQDGKSKERNGHEGKAERTADNGNSGNSSGGDGICTMPAVEKLCMATGYFNLTPRYQALLVKGACAHAEMCADSEHASTDVTTSKETRTIEGVSGTNGLSSQRASSLERMSSPVEILTSSPEANGFFGAPGIRGALPMSYTLLARDFLDGYNNSWARAQTRAQAAASLSLALEPPTRQQQEAGQHKEQQPEQVPQQASRVPAVSVEPMSMLEYGRPGWTFHAKGLWIYLRSQQHKQQHGTASNRVGITAIGSPNFGERSVNRDLESQAIVLTENKQLQKALHEEWQELTDGKGQHTRRVVRLQKPAHDQAAQHLRDGTVCLWTDPQRQLQGCCSWEQGHWIRPVTKMIESFL
jgi:phosphatidylserine/phosphatidylglycerophosphate/cardiolipin synthase-like enzyme